MATRNSQADALQALYQQTVALFHRLKAAAEQLHGQGELTAARRGVLLGLRLRGPQTVPEMARIRPVSRQHIQNLVNQLKRDGLVKLQKNPAHKKSQLVILTDKGESFLDALLNRERDFGEQLQLNVSLRDLSVATSTLENVRIALENAFNSEEP